MSREIKFRAWDKYEREWINAAAYCNLYGSIEASYVEPQGGVIVSQYIGLKDKNGVEIYEGDIVDIDYLQTWDHGEQWQYKAQRSEVSYEGYGFYPFAEGAEGDGMYSKCEVIGNIYEHGHLLENEE